VTKFKAIVVALALLASSCGTQSDKSPSGTTGSPKRPEQPLDGYAGLKFGMSFNDALSIAPPSSFNPASLKDCLVELAIRGCLLGAGDNLTPYRTVAGIPYGIKLAFNRFDKLTDISLTYVRESIEDPDQRISSPDCISIHERTLDWLTDEFGQGFVPLDKSKILNAKTLKGNGYYRDPKSPTFVLVSEKKLPKGRTILLNSFFLDTGGETSCNIEVTFGEPQSVERWQMSPEDKADFDRVTSGSTETEQAGE
jgi:hypothetical protein